MISFMNCGMFILFTFFIIKDECIFNNVLLKSIITSVLFVLFYITD